MCVRQLVCMGKFIEYKNHRIYSLFKLTLSVGMGNSDIGFGETWLP